MALIGIMDERHALLPHRVAGPVDAGDQDEPSGRALARAAGAQSASPRPVPPPSTASPPLLSPRLYDRTYREHGALIPGGPQMFFTFPEDATRPRCRRLQRGPRPVRRHRPGRSLRFPRLLDQSPTPGRCLEAFHLQQTRFELVVERNLRRRQLTEGGNVEINGRNLRERSTPVGQSDFEPASSTI